MSSPAREFAETLERLILDGRNLLPGRALQFVNAGAPVKVRVEGLGTLDAIALTPITKPKITVARTGSRAYAIGDVPTQQQERPVSEVRRRPKAKEALARIAIVFTELVDFSAPFGSSAREFVYSVRVGGDRKPTQIASISATTALNGYAEHDVCFPHLTKSGTIVLDTIRVNNSNEVVANNQVKVGGNGISWKTPFAIAAVTGVGQTLTNQCLIDSLGYFALDASSPVIRGFRGYSRIGKWISTAAIAIKQEIILSGTNATLNEGEFEQLVKQSQKPIAARVVFREANTDPASATEDCLFGRMKEQSAKILPLGIEDPEEEVQLNPFLTAKRWKIVAVLIAPKR